MKLILLATLYVLVGVKASFAWDPPDTGPIPASYELEVSDGSRHMSIFTEDTRKDGVLCSEKLRTVRIAALDAEGNSGPFSPSSVPYACVEISPDLNGDTLINGLDFGVLIEDQVDFNRDGVFDGMDFADWIVFYTATPFP